MSRLRLVFIVSLLCTSDAFAQTGSASYYLPWCQLNAARHQNSADEAIKSAHCGGQMLALIKAAPFLERPMKFCPPENIHISDVSQVVVHYLQSVPQRQGEPFVTLALEALRQEWPCR